MNQKIDSKTTAMGQGSKLLTDLGPVVLFMLVFNFGKRFFGDETLYVATAIFMVACIAALAYALWVEKRVPKMLAVTALVVLFFGGLTLYFKSPLFILYKPTIINLFWAVVIFGGLALRFNVWQYVFDSAFQLPDEAWRIFAMRWGVFFIFLALLNEVVWRFTALLPGENWWSLAPLTDPDPAFWVNFKVFGVMPITFVFIMFQFPLLNKYHDFSKERKSSSETDADKG